MKYSIYKSKDLANAVIYSYDAYKSAILEYSSTIEIIDQLFKILKKQKNLSKNQRQNIKKFTHNLSSLYIFYMWRELYMFEHMQSIIDGDHKLWRRLQECRNWMSIKNKYNQDIIDNVYVLENKRK